MKRLCVVGKGSSLLSQDIGELIDSHDVIIRVNHLPDADNFNIVGSKTHIFSTRSPEKLLNHIHLLDDLKIWITSNFIEKYTRFDTDKLKMLTSEEMTYIQMYFSNFMNLKLQENSTLKNIVLPDAGISTVLLALLRFPLHKINVCGIDLYKDGNQSINELRNNSSIFLTPVFQQMLYYKTLIKSGAINQLY